MGKGQMREAKDAESLVDSIEKIVINPYDDHKWFYWIEANHSFLLIIIIIK